MKCTGLFFGCFYQITSAHVDQLKNITASGRGMFALYGNNANFKNLLRIFSRAFNEILQRCSLCDSLSDFFASC